MKSKLRREIPPDFRSKNGNISSLTLGSNAHDYHGFFSVTCEGSKWSHGTELYWDFTFINDFLNVLGVDDLFKANGALCRVLTGEGVRILGFAHIIEDKVLVIEDYAPGVDAPAKVVDLKHVAESIDPAFGEDGPPRQPVGMTDRYTKAYNKAWSSAKKRGGSDATAHYFGCRAAADVDDGESGIFTMSSISPPPGAPWIVKRRSGGAPIYDLTEGGDGPRAIVAKDLSHALVKWLVDEAQIATRHPDDDDIPF